MSWPGVTKKSLGPDLYALVTARTAAQLWKPEARYRPDPRFLRWRLDKPDAGIADGEG